MRAFFRVMWREVGIIARRPILWIATIGIPLFSALFMTTIFGDGAIRDIPIGVVDRDFTSTSREIIRTIDSSPTLHVVRHFNSSGDALQALRKRDIYGYVIMPADLSRNMELGTPAAIPYYYHYAFMSVGAQVESTLRTLLTMASVDPMIVAANEMGVSEEQMECFVEPLNSDTHPLGNPSLNYRTYLAEPIFFIMFQIVILITTVYVLGSEREHGRVWLAAAGGNIITALVGKFVPYAFVFAVSGMAAIYVMFDVAAIATIGLWGMVGAMVGLVVASISLALFVYSLYPRMSLILSAVSVIGSLGATLSGVTFPIDSMYPIFRYVAFALPIRHFTFIMQNMLYVEGGYEAVRWHAAIIVAFCLLPLITASRLRKTIINGGYEER